MKHTTLVGRSKDQKTLRSTVQRRPLVLALGAPGVGKTSLARAVFDEWNGPKIWVELANVRAARDLAGAAARALGLRGPKAAERVSLALASQPGVMLVLDNFEQLLPAGAQVLRSWLHAAPNAHLLVTSRQRLDIGESCFEVVPLTERAAVQLLRQRAPRTARAGLVPLARKLGGIPLALELAAARLNIFTADQLLERLPETLAAVRRAHAPVRHQGLHAALAWSWNLLDPIEQRVLGQCAGFHGGFTVAAAEATIDAGTASVVDVLQSLESKSLLHRRVETAGTRLDLSPPLKELVLSRILSADRAAFRHRHAVYFAELAKNASPPVNFFAGLSPPPEPLAAERENLLAAFAGASGPELLAHLFLGLQPLWLASGPLEQALAAAQRLEGLEGLPDPLALRLWTRIGALKRAAGFPSKALAAYERALAVSTRIGDRSSEAQLYAAMAPCHDSLGENGKAERCLDRAQQVEAVAHEPVLQAWVLLSRFFHDLSRGAGVGLATAEQAVRLLERKPDDAARAWALCYRGLARQEVGQHDEAARDYQQAYALARRALNVRCQAYARGLSATLAAERGQVEAAGYAAQKAVELAHRIQDERFAAFFTCVLAWRHLQRREKHLAALAIERVEATALATSDSDLRAVAGVFAAMWHLHGKSAARHATAVRRAAVAKERANASWDARWALRLLDVELNRLAKPARVQRHALRVSPDGERFVLPGSEGALRLDKHRPAARLLAYLAEQRLDAPNRALAVEELAQAVWAEQPMLRVAALNRVHVGLSRLRSLGLKPLLHKRGDGYLISAQVPVVISPL